MRVADHAQNCITERLGIARRHKKPVAIATNNGAVTVDIGADNWRTSRHRLEQDDAKRLAACSGRDENVGRLKELTLFLFGDAAEKLNVFEVSRQHVATRLTISGTVSNYDQAC